MLNVSGDSYCTEICRAYWSTVVRKIGVFILWHYRTVCKSKSLLVFNLFLFINKLQLAILTYHYFVTIMIAQEGLFLSFRDAN